MEQVPVALARWAVGPGLAAVGDATRMLDDGLDDLALAGRLRAGLPSDRAAFAAQAAHARRRARAGGGPGAEQLVLTRESLEQASHPLVARWRAGRAAAAGRPLQDWCAGTGGDAVALADHGPVLAVESDPGRAVLARHRARVLRRPVRVLVADVLSGPVDPTGAVVHADPDRRDPTGRRARSLATHRPGLAALYGAAGPADGVLAAVAPGLAWDDPDLPADAEVVFLQVDDRLVEACLATGTVSSGVRARAVLLTSGGVHERARTGPVEQLPVGPIGTWLVRPSVAAVRARLHDTFGPELSARRVARTRALLSTDERPPPSSWWRAERVLVVVGARPAAVGSALRDLPGRRVELVVHGLPVDPEQFLRRAGRPPTGPDDVRVHLVRRDHDAVAVVTG